MAGSPIRITNSRGGMFLRYLAPGKQGGGKVVRLLPAAYNNIRTRLIKL